MWKSIQITWPTRTIYVFQHGDRLWWSPDWDFHNHKVVVDGNNGIRGERGLVIRDDNYWFFV